MYLTAVLEASTVCILTSLGLKVFKAVLLILCMASLLSWYGNEQGLHVAEETPGIGFGVGHRDGLAILDNALQLVLAPLPKVVQLHKAVRSLRL